ncbi:MAG: RelA/SpoT family protein [Hyphomicrobiales bacterium]
MMRQYELVERVTAYDPGADEALLNRAYVYAMRAHGHQTRASGDPYFSHPLEVAAILTQLKLDDATIVAALLHDTIEDTEATRAEIDDMFGDEIGALVDGLTKIKRLDLVSKEAAQAENLRKLLVAISNDIRVLLVKLADRLHNMRTLEHVPVHKRRRIAEETMDIYAPLAGRMGMQEMRDELEDLSFEVLNPDARNTIMQRLETLRKESGNVIVEIESALKERLQADIPTAVVKGREKRPHSIWRKMDRKQISLGQLSDIYAFRLIVDEVDQCYQALGLVHQSWRVVPGRFKDYISTPKQNDYRSIHTTVVGPHHKRVELQIRTHEMHEVAEKGVAAHALYKDAANAGAPEAKGNGHAGAVPLSKESNAYRWLRRLVDLLSEGDTPQEFLEHTKLELFHDQVFCFTPNGHLIALPRGATPIDFAYAVHTDIGNSCVGCRINGRHAPLISELENGDEVEIIRSDAQVPPAAWESFAVTGKARSAIRRATREAVRHQYAGLGKEILERTLKKQGREHDDQEIEKAVGRLGLQHIEDLYASIGRGEFGISEVIKAIDRDGEDLPKPLKRRAAAGLLSLSNLSKVIRLPGARGKPDRDTAIPVRGLNSDLPISMAPGEGAVPGDRIIGILTPGKGIEIYPIHSRALQQFDDQADRWIDLAWDIGEGTDQRFSTRIRVTLLNEVGALAQVALVISENEGNIANLSMVSRAPDFYEMHIEIEVADAKHLARIMSELKKKGVVSRVARITG